MQVGIAVGEILLSLLESGYSVQDVCGRIEVWCGKRDGVLSRTARKRRAAGPIVFR